jgi:hypothetical protein
MSQRSQADVPPQAAYYEESPYGACEPCFSPRLGFQCSYTVPDTQNQDWLFYDPGTPDYTPPAYDPVDDPNWNPYPEPAPEKLSAVIKGPIMQPGDVYGPCEGEQVTNCYYPSMDDCINIAFDPAAGDPRYQLARSGPKFQGAMLKAKREAQCPQFMCSSKGYTAKGGKIMFDKDACKCVGAHGTEGLNVAINQMDRHGLVATPGFQAAPAQPAIDQLMYGPEAMPQLFQPGIVKMSSPAAAAKFSASGGKQLPLASSVPRFRGPRLFV